MYFNLKKPTSSKDTLIILRYYISKKEGRFVYSTGLTINPDDWNKKSKSANVKKGRTDLSSINRKLQEYSNFLEKTLSNFELNNVEITKENLKIKFLQEFKPSTTEKRFIYFTDFVDDFLKKAPNLTNRHTKEKYSSYKIKHYKKTNNRVKEFQLHQGKKIRLDNFKLSDYDALVDYLKEERKYAINSVGEIIKNAKVFLNKADEFGYKVHSDYKKSGFTILKEETTAVVLDEKEIEQLFNFDFSDNERLQNCRDLAIIGLWTGLRVSDFLTLPEINIQEDFIEVQPKKTKKTSGIKVVIPLHHHIKEVISDRGMPRMISDVKFNEYIKEVCEKVGFTKMVKGSIMTKESENSPYRKKKGVYEKYKLISSHTCRRSFATNLYKMNFPTLSIMAITGHTTEKSFLTYIKVTPMEHAQKLLDHWKKYYKKNR